MNNLPSTPTYPVAYFLHSALACPQTLKTLLGTPNFPKVKKARLLGYTKEPSASGSTVRFANYNFGAWADEEQVCGVVYMVGNAEEETRLLKCVGEGVRLEGAVIEVKEGLFGDRRRVEGVVFCGEGGGKAGCEEEGMTLLDALWHLDPPNASTNEAAAPRRRGGCVPLGTVEEQRETGCCVRHGGGEDVGDEVAQKKSLKAVLVRPETSPQQEEAQEEKVEAVEGNLESKPERTSTSLRRPGFLRKLSSSLKS